MTQSVLNVLNEWNVLVTGPPVHSLETFRITWQPAGKVPAIVLAG